MVRAFCFICVVLFAVVPGNGADVVSPRKFLWTELIAFDNTLPDYGVGEFLLRSKFKPDAVSLLLVDSSLFENHKGDGV